MADEMKSPILVTGASGHTGKRLVKHLCDLGVEVKALSRFPETIPLETRRRIQVIRVGLENEQQVVEAMRGCSAVVAMTHIKFAELVIDRMKTAGVQRGVFTSSTRRFTKFPEETARQVIAGEATVEASGLDYTILRPSMIYGGREDNNMEHIAQALRTYPVFPLVGGGKMLWQPVFTLDVVAAIDSALRRDETIGKSITLAGPGPISYRDMVETIARAVHKKPILLPVPMGLASLVVCVMEKMSANPRVRIDQIHRLQEDKVFDIGPARELLDWQPRSFENGIALKVRKEA